MATIQVLTSMMVMAMRLDKRDNAAAIGMDIDATIGFKNGKSS